MDITYFNIYMLVFVISQVLPKKPRINLLLNKAVVGQYVVIGGKILFVDDFAAQQFNDWLTAKMLWDVKYDPDIELVEVYSKTKRIVLVPGTILLEKIQMGDFTFDLMEEI